MNTSDPKPSIESQLAQPMPDPAFPHFGRDALDRNHAVYSIIEHLATLGLSDWVPHLTQWLAHYDGLEMYAEDEEDPQLCVRQILQNHCDSLKQKGEGTSNNLVSAEDAQALKARIVGDILNLNFVRYRAHWGRDLVPDAASRQWDPLKMSWFDFLKQGDPDHPTEALHITMTERHPQPPLDTLRAHLLQPAT